MPVVTVALAHPGKVRAGALGTPQEGVVVDGLTGDGIVAVALGLCAQGADHLRVAHVTALADVDIPPLQLERREWLEAGDRLPDLFAENQGYQFDQGAEAERHDDRSGAGGAYCGPGP